MATLLCTTRLILVVAVALCATVAFGRDLRGDRSFKDMKCLKNPPPPAQVDMEWVSNVGDWYVPAGSQLDLNLLSAELLNVSATDVAPHELYYNGCIHWLWTERSSILTGFGGKEADLDMQPDRSMGVDGWWNFRMPNLGLENNQVMITLTDNATFAMLYACWPATNEASWDLISTVPKLPTRTMKRIHAHAKSLGFSEKQFTGIRFDTC